MFSPQISKRFIDLILDVLTNLVEICNITDHDVTNDCSQVSSATKNGYETNSYALLIALAETVLERTENDSPVQILKQRMLWWAIACIQDFIRPSQKCSIPDLDAILCASGSFDAAKLEKQMQSRFVQLCTVTKSTMCQHRLSKEAMPLIMDAFYVSTLFSQENGSESLMNEWNVNDELKVKCDGEKAANPRECGTIIETRNQAITLDENDDNHQPYVKKIAKFFELHPP